MNESIVKQIKEYVYKNYKSYQEKQLIIKECNNCFHILKHKDASPLILSKKIIK
jgi:hypothetical protein